MVTTRVDVGGIVRLPKELRDRLAVDEGDLLDWEVEADRVTVHRQDVAGTHSKHPDALSAADVAGVLKAYSAGGSYDEDAVAAMLGEEDRESVIRDDRGDAGSTR
jgi:bifunctional DNA-binding transcriptional regulator/antitoxin component of YhaV-PrlF toxin-antitoxin module